MEIGIIQKNSQEIIKVTIQDYKGTKLVDLRTYWQNSEDKWVPTKKGISLTPTILEDVINLLLNAFDLLEMKRRHSL